MTLDNARIPYFDDVFASIAGRPESDLARVFGMRHVHWGYYANPERADTSAQALMQAAEALTTCLSELAAVRDDDAILDVGCGFGGTIAHLNERFTGLQLTGLNIDERQVSRARELVRPRPGNALAFLKGDACALPCASASFDVVMAVECIFHFSSRERFLREARRVLKPGGCLVLSDFVPYGPTLPLLIGWGVYAQSKLKAFFGDQEPSLCTALVYRWLAARTGFRLEVDEDITEHTLPTYPALLRIFRTDGHTVAEQATQLMAWASARKLIRYRLLKLVAV